MVNLQLKKYWQKIITWRDYDADKLLINPAQAWLILVCLFFVGLLFVLTGLALLQTEISRREAAIIANSGTTAEKLNEQKLQLILTDHTKRVEEFAKLQLAKPSVLDPGM